MGGNTEFMRKIRQKPSTTTPIAKRVDMWQCGLTTLCRMEERNITWQNYFIIRGVTDLSQLQAAIFMQVLLIYLIIICGNSAIILLICKDSQLHTPMYHFLCHLSFMDVCYSTVTMHKALDAYVSGDKRVPFSACIAQMYFYVALLCCEFWLLTAMSYDRYVAICIPLRYVMIMNKKLCTLMTAACWILGILEALPAVFIIYDIYCFKSNIINHFFCDLLPIMKLLCHSNYKMEHMLYVQSLFVGFLPFSLTIMSYVYIIRAILRIHSSTGRWKTFYTCFSHIAVVSLLYVTIFSLYMRPTSAITLESDKLFALFYTALTPMLNPLIYSLKNVDVKLAFWRLRGWWLYHLNGEEVCETAATPSQQLGTEELNSSYWKSFGEFSFT
ncbi:olfactory receptor 5AR1-like [Mantella aurantiaca]